MRRVMKLNGLSELPMGASLFRPDNLTSQSSPESATFQFPIEDLKLTPGKGRVEDKPSWHGRVRAAGRLYLTSQRHRFSICESGLTSMLLQSMTSGPM